MSFYSSAILESLTFIYVSTLYTRTYFCMYMNLCLHTCMYRYLLLFFVTILCIYCGFTQNLIVQYLFLWCPDLKCVLAGTGVGALWGYSHSILPGTTLRIQKGHLLLDMCLLIILLILCHTLLKHHLSIMTMHTIRWLFIQQLWR